MSAPYLLSTISSLGPPETNQVFLSPGLYSCLCGKTEGLWAKSLFVSGKMNGTETIGSALTQVGRIGEHVLKWEGGKGVKSQ
jgi:hypothetical protein